MTAEQALIRLYQQAAQRLRLQIRAAIESGQIGTAAYRAQQLQRVQNELRQLGKRSRPLALRIAFDEYVRGSRIVDVGLALPAGAAGFEFAGAHVRAATVIANNLALTLDRVEQLVGRRTDDAFRRAALEEVGGGIARGATRKEVSKAIAERLIREKVTDATTGFVARNGARWQLDTYTEMAARTTTREAMSAGTANRMRDLSLDLIEISNHNTSTEICQNYEGKVFSINGTTPGYEVIDQMPPFHPNCLHYATPAGANLAALERQLGIAA